MGGTTEPILVVIGHPIAGNPSQFALERALHSMDLDWRVLSFDVPEQDIPVALDGFDVTGIAGVLIDDSVSDSVSRWFANKHPAAEDQQQAEEQQAEEQQAEEQQVIHHVIDCLSRDEAGHFVGTRERDAFVIEKVSEQRGENRICIGDFIGDTGWDAAALSAKRLTQPITAELIKNANAILIAEDADGPVELEIEEWPTDDGSTLVVDLTSGHPDVSAVDQLGYSVLTEVDRQTGKLQRCLRRWTGQCPTTAVIRDAMEEYLGV